MPSIVSSCLLRCVICSLFGARALVASALPSSTGSLCGEGPGSIQGFGFAQWGGPGHSGGASVFTRGR
eukprot:3842459-Pyramimonas_sp.AAC.1